MINYKLLMVILRPFTILIEIYQCQAEALKAF